MSNRRIERRASARHPGGALRALQARIRPGHAAALIDVSAGGALVETGRRLLPNTFVEIHMQNESRRATLRGRVVRCAVVRVSPSAVHYRAAVQFDSYLPWFIEDDGYVVHEGGVAGRVDRAAATPQAW